MQDFKHNKHDFFQKGSSSDGLQIIQLSLFIMLLAFFIVLNITSNFQEERVEPVIKSLYRAFYTDKFPTSMSIAQPDPAIVKSLQQEDAADYIRELFKSDLPGLKLIETNRDDVMLIAFDRPEFETFMSSQNVTSFDRLVAALLYLQQKNMPMAIDVTVSKKEIQPVQEVYGRLARYAAALEKRGVSEKLISVSTARKTYNDKDVMVTFRPYYGYAPSQQKKGEE